MHNQHDFSGSAFVVRPIDKKGVGTLLLTRVEIQAAKPARAVARSTEFKESLENRPASSGLR